MSTQDDDFFDVVGPDLLFDCKSEDNDVEHVSSDSAGLSPGLPPQLSPMELPRGGVAAPVQQMTLFREVARFHKSFRQAGFHVKSHPEESPPSTLSAGQHRQRIGIASKEMVPECVGFPWEPILHPGQVADIAVPESNPPSSARSLDAEFVSSALPKGERVFGIRGETSREVCRTRRLSPTWEASIKKKRAVRPSQVTRRHPTTR
jgi:hypothetical protein